MCRCIYFFILAGIYKNMINFNGKHSLANRYNPVDLSFAVWIIYLTVNGLLVSDGDCNIYPYLFIFGCYCCCRLVPIPPRMLFCAVALVGGWQSFVSIAQWMGYAESNHTLFSVTGSFGNPGQLGCFLAVSIMCIVCLWRSKDGISKKMCWMSLLAIHVPAIVLADSRTAWISVLCGTVYLCYEKRLLKNKFVRYFAGISILLVVLGASYFYKSRSANGRLLVWRVCMDMAVDKPVFGHGIDGFNKRYMQYQAEYFERNPDSDYVEYSDNISYPYNEYLHILIEQGIVGLLLWFVVIFSALLVPARNNKYKAVLIAYLTICLFSYPFYVPGLLVLLPLLLSAIRTKTFCIKTYAVPFRSILFVVTVFCLAVSTKEYIVKHYCDKAVHGLFSVYSRADAETYVENNFDTILNNPFLSDIYAQYAFDDYEPERALGILNTIKDYSPTSEIYCDMGDLYRQLGDYDNAISCYRVAENMIPRRLTPKYKLFLLYKDMDNAVMACKYGRDLLSKSFHVEGTRTLTMKRDVIRYLNDTEASE